MTSVFFGAGDGNRRLLGCRLAYYLAFATAQALLPENCPLDSFLDGKTLSGSIPTQHKIKKRRRMSSLFYGAGDGNRTHTTSLEGWSSTTKLHLHIFCYRLVTE